MLEQRFQDAGGGSESRTAPWLTAERLRAWRVARPGGLQRPCAAACPAALSPICQGPGHAWRTVGAQQSGRGGRRWGRCWPRGPRPACVLPVRRLVTCGGGAGVTGCLQQSVTPRFVLRAVPPLGGLVPVARGLRGDLQPGPRWRLWSHLLGAFRGGSRCGQSSSC